MISWDDYFIRLAHVVALKSKDPSTKVGCVIVSQDHQILATGFNGFPRGVKELEPAPEVGNYREDAKLIADRWEKRPEKYKWVEHAERNAVYQAARYGISLINSIAYLNWQPTPCEDCARALIQSGVSEIVGPDIPFKGVGVGTFYGIQGISQIMLEEAGVSTRIWRP